jgi:hypothetical protein
MPAELQTGKGLLYGITNSGAIITMLGFATFILDAVKGAHKFKLEAIEDELNADVSLIATNPHVEIDVTWTPSGASRAAAAATAVFLTPLTKVTLANFKVAAFNGDWIYVGDESIDLSHAAGKLSLKLRKYDDPTQNASLTTTVNG